MLAGAAIAAAGQLCLLLVTPATGYPRLVPALLGVGLGVGMFTAPVVAAAMRAVPPERSGLASGINNTARQAGTALGVAALRRDRGQPDPRRSLHRRPALARRRRRGRLAPGGGPDLFGCARACGREVMDRH